MKKTRIMIKDISKTREGKRGYSRNFIRNHNELGRNIKK
jgi:hypothetical protein